MLLFSPTRAFYQDLGQSVLECWNHEGNAGMMLSKRTPSFKIFLRVKTSSMIVVSSLKQYAPHNHENLSPRPRLQVGRRNPQHGQGMHVPMADLSADFGYFHRIMPLLDPVL